MSQEEKEWSKLREDCKWTYFLYFRINCSATRIVITFEVISCRSLYLLKWNITHVLIYQMVDPEPLTKQREDLKSDESWMQQIHPISVEEYSRTVA
jgi:hypothetical protein